MNINKKNSTAFYRFVHFGGFSSKTERERLATWLLSELNHTSGLRQIDNYNNSYTSAIMQLVAKPIVSEICLNDDEAKVRVAHEILSFVSNTSMKISKHSNPFQMEQQLMDELKIASEKDIVLKWEAIGNQVKQIYPDENIDVSFYMKEFEKSIEQRSKKYIETSFRNVKEHLVEKWEGLLIQKKMKWEVNLINEEMKSFSIKLTEQLEKLKLLRQLLKPFTDHMGRLWDLSKGDWQKVGFDALEKYAKILEKDKALNELAELLGRTEQAEQIMEEETFVNTRLTPEWKVNPAINSDLVGIYQSDDISSLLPAEVALLSDVNLETVFYKKFAEKKLQTFEYHGKSMTLIEEKFADVRTKKEDQKKGPFIICADTSGSMHGAPENIAKAISLALLKTALRDQRACFLISFSTQIKTLDLSDMKNSIDDIVSFLSMSFHGGTDATPALNEALNNLETKKYKKADVIVVSDFVMPALDRELAEKIVQAKKNKTKFHSLVIGNRNNPKVIKEFNNNWFYNTNDSENTLTLVKNLSTL